MKEKFKVSKDFILEAHKDACSTWKTKIENQFPELFPKVEPVTGWFKQKQSYGYWLGYYENDEIKYTITDDGFKTIKLKQVRNLDDCKEEVKATKEEVEIALIAEAKKRGFKKGVTYIDTCGIKRKADYDAKFFHDYGKNGGYSLDCGDGKGLIFFNGKWAEIISEPIEISLEERVKTIEEQLKKLK